MASERANGELGVKMGAVKQPGIPSPKLDRIVEELAAGPGVGRNESSDTLRQLLVFSLGKEKYAMDVRVLKRIVWVGDITPVPGVPKHILGIINLQGDIVSVVDLKQLLGLQTQKAPRPCIMVTSAGGMDVGFMVDSADDLIDLPSRSIDLPLITVEREYAEFLEGEARVHETLVAILDYERIMGSEGMRLAS
jgi:purine-binding chemotaxis protein CheW